MGRLIIFSLLGVWLTSGAMGANLLPNSSDETDKLAMELAEVQDMSFGGLGGRGSFQELANYIKQLNPDLYNRVQSETPAHQRMVYRSYAIKHIFDEYKNYYLQEIQNTAYATGRQLLTHSQESTAARTQIVDGIEQTWKLDDASYLYNCGYPPNQQHTDAYKWCHVTNDIEEYKIEYNAYGYGYNKSVGDALRKNNDSLASSETLIISKSLIPENRFSNYHFSLNITTDSDEAKMCQKYGLGGQYRLSFSSHDVSRTEYYKHFNKTVDDMLAGMMSLKGKFCNSHGKCQTMWTVRQPDKWESRFLPVGKLHNISTM